MWILQQFEFSVHSSNEKFKLFFEFKFFSNFFFLQKIGVDEIEGVDEKSDKKWHKEGVQPKKWCPWQKFFYVLFSVTQSFFLDSHESLIILQWATSKTLLVNMGCLYIHMSLKMRLRLKNTFFDIFWYIWYAEAAIYTKKLFFSHSIIWYFQWITQERSRNGVVQMIFLAPIRNIFLAELLERIFYNVE